MDIFPNIAGGVVWFVFCNILYILSTAVLDVFLDFFGSNIIDSLLKKRGISFGVVGGMYGLYLAVLLYF